MDENAVRFSWTESEKFLGGSISVPQVSLMNRFQTWLQTHKVELAAVSDLVSVAGVIASVVLVVISLVISFQAKNTARRLEAKAEKVRVDFDATFQADKELKPLPGSLRAGSGGILQLHVNLKLINLNPFRPVVIERLVPFFQEPNGLVTPSDLKVKFKSRHRFPLTLPSLRALQIETQISWPIGAALSKRIDALLIKSARLTLKELLLDLGQRSSQGRYSERYKRIILRIYTQPEAIFDKSLTLY